MVALAEPVPSLACFDLLSDFDNPGFDFLDLHDSLLDPPSCDDSTDWMRELWDGACEKLEGSSALETSVSSALDGTTYEPDRISIVSSEQPSVADAISAPGDTAASCIQATQGDQSSAQCDVTTLGAASGLSLELDVPGVLSAWKKSGGSVDYSPSSAGAAAVALHLPPAEASTAALIAEFGCYRSFEYATAFASGGMYPSCSMSGSVPGSPAVSGGMHNFVPVATMNMTSVHGSNDASGALFGGSNGISSGTTAPALLRSTSSASNVTGGARASGVPAGAPAWSADAKTARAACALRCKQKRSLRQSTKLRYEMRKINAEQRPRFKGRFVKRDSMPCLGDLDSDALRTMSVSSAASGLSETQWLL